MSTQSSPQAAVDGRLRSTFANDPEMAELVEYFVSELADRVSALRAAIEHEDRPTIKKLAHQLKGAAGGYGFPDITTAAAEVERQAVSNSAPVESLRDAVQSLIHLCKRAVK